MKKIIFLLVFLTMFLTGCSSEYNIEFSNGKIKENIVVNILDSDIPKAPANQLYDVDDRVTPFIKNNQYPIFGNTDIIYDKNVKKEGNNTRVTLDYTYTHDEYRNSTVYKSCFENAYLINNKKNYELNFSGSFYCLYGNELVINIKTNNEVISNNADKVNGNIYTWIINKDNVTNADIQMTISKHSRYYNIIVYCIVGVILICLSIVGYIVYKKIRNNDSVNDI